MQDTAAIVTRYGTSTATSSRAGSMTPVLCASGNKFARNLNQKIGHNIDQLSQVEIPCVIFAAMVTAALLLCTAKAALSQRLQYAQPPVQDERNKYLLNTCRLCWLDGLEAVCFMPAHQHRPSRHHSGRYSFGTTIYLSYVTQ